MTDWLAPVLRVWRSFQETLRPSLGNPLPPLPPEDAVLEVTPLRERQQLERWQAEIQRRQRAAGIDVDVVDHAREARRRAH